MKIYTKSGDDGTTGLYGGARVAKDSPRVVAYGAVDETNAAIGVAVAACDDEELIGWLRAIQSDLFVLGGELANPKADPAVPSLASDRIDAMEELIDRIERELDPVKWFVLPGGAAPAAALHLARTVCRRAERELVSLGQSESIRPQPAVYLNRLSDCLFVMARLANRRMGTEDIPWSVGDR
ncbi:MAG: cob(I)yrinic acid a,c-diamide adenosyltransferase [Phycisphaerae bacterium]